jgi:hypothetical protein
MTDKSFNEERAAQDIITAILGSPWAVSESLAAAAGLSVEARTYIAEVLEKEIFVNVYTRLSADDINAVKKVLLVELATARLGNSKLTGRLDETVKGISVLDEVIKFISDTRGDAAHPLIKSYVAEVSKLSDEDYSLPENRFKVLIDAVEKSPGVAPAAPKKNPFRPGAPG